MYYHYLGSFNDFWNIFAFSTLYRWFKSTFIVSKLTSIAEINSLIKVAFNNPKRIIRTHLRRRLILAISPFQTLTFRYIFNRATYLYQWWKLVNKLFYIYIIHSFQFIWINIIAQIDDDVVSCFPIQLSCY